MLLIKCSCRIIIKQRILLNYQKSNKSVEWLTEATINWRDSVSWTRELAVAKEQKINIKKVQFELSVIKLKKIRLVFT